MTNRLNSNSELMLRKRQTRNIFHITDMTLSVWNEWVFFPNCRQSCPIVSFSIIFIKYPIELFLLPIISKAEKKTHLSPIVTKQDSKSVMYPFQQPLFGVVHTLLGCTVSSIKIWSIYSNTTSLPCSQAPCA